MSRVTPNDPRDAWLAAALRSHAGSSRTGHDCPHPDGIWDAVRLQVPLEDRLAIIDHVSECPTCAEAWSLATELASADQHTAPAPVNASRRVSVLYRRSALLMGAAAAIIVVIGVAFMVFRTAAQPDTVSIKPSPTAPPTAQQTPSPAPTPSPVRPPLLVPDADEAAIRQLIATYEQLLKTKELARFNTIRPNPTAAELEALQNEFGPAGLRDVSIELVSLRIEGRIARAEVRRRDAVVVDGRRQDRTYRRLMVFEKTPSDTWVLAR